MDKDWRLFREQEKYLYGVALIHQPYMPSSSSNDHDHCEFCMEKFGKDVEDLKEGYSTLDNNIWICPQCYEDFKKKFAWKLVNKQ